MPELESILRTEMPGIIKKTANGVEYRAASNLLMMDVPHAFTTRIGGVSDGFFSSLNMGVSRGDRREHVLKNYEILFEALGLPLENSVFFRQVHGSDVRVVTRADTGLGLFRDSDGAFDGMVTNDPEVSLVVFGADCVPVILYDPVSRSVGAVHSGWRGTVKAAVVSTIRKMCGEFGARPENIRAAIGPAIGPCCFETDDDVPYALTEAMGLAAHLRMSRAGKDRWHVDIKSINLDLMINEGVPDYQIAVSRECTGCLPELYWSQRKMGGDRGVQCAVIALPK